MDQSGECRKQTGHGFTHVDGCVSMRREVGMDCLVPETLAAYPAAGWKDA